MNRGQKLIARTPHKGFTLIELLVVIAIIAVIAAILFPVFASAREKARQTTCASNEKQISIAFLQYVQDNDETFPMGRPYSTSANHYRGAGWFSEIYSYVQAGVRNGASNGTGTTPTGAFGVEVCPDDPTAIVGAHAPIDYAYNGALVYSINGYGGIPIVSMLTSADHTVLLCEVSTPWYGAYCNAWDSALNGDYSPGVNGYGGSNIEPGVSPAYETGYMKDLGAGDYAAYYQAAGRHNGGSNFAFCDGHVKWLMGGSISTGMAAATPATTASDDAGKYNAAGTAVAGYVGTFSPI